jgi:hypothetical protein
MKAAPGHGGQPAAGAGLHPLPGVSGTAAPCQAGGMRILPRRWVAAAAGPAVLIAALACTSAVARAAGQPARTFRDASCLVSTVPLYSPAMWKAAAGRSPEAGVGIANWGSNTQNGGAGGPGKTRNAADAARISAAQADGTRILGYIATDYARGAAGYGRMSIETQMTDWHRWYGVTAFFLDEAPTATTHQPYYAAVKAWAHRHIGASAQEWLNMGTYPAAASWMRDANTIMDWEDSAAPATPPVWVHNYPASRFAMIMNAVPDTASAIAAAVTDIEHAHAGAGFVTSDVSYQTLPSWSYWTAFSTDAASPGCTQ